MKSLKSNFLKFLFINYHIMNTKKLLFLSAAMFSLLLVAGCGTKTTTTSDATTSTTPTTTATTTNATKDQCIELMAYAFKVAQLQAQ